MRPRLRTLTRLVAAALCTVLALGAVIHLPPVMRWLGAHGHHGAGLCPLGYGVVRSHGDAPPHPDASRGALGFELGQTNATDVIRWGLLHGSLCRERHHGADVECAGASLGEVAAPPASLTFLFDDMRTLRAIQVTRRGPAAAEIAVAFESRSNALATTSGAPVKRSGSSDPADLARGALRQAMVEYRTPDLLAVLRVTNMGDGFVLTEHYALIDRSGSRSGS